MNNIVKPFLMKFLVKKEICESRRRQKCATKKGLLILKKKKKMGYLEHVWIKFFNNSIICFHNS